MTGTPGLSARQVSELTSYLAFAGCALALVPAWMFGPVDALVLTSVFIGLGLVVSAIAYLFEGVHWTLAYSMPGAMLVAGALACVLPPAAVLVGVLSAVFAAGSLYDAVTRRVRRA